MLKLLVAYCNRTLNTVYNSSINRKDPPSDFLSVIKFLLMIKENYLQLKKIKIDAIQRKPFSMLEHKGTHEK